MNKKVINSLDKEKIMFKRWVTGHYFQIALFNMITIVLFLLYSAGYFRPYFAITINFIVLIMLILSVVLLQAKSLFLFIVSLSFWIFAAFLRMVGIEVWAERTSIYVYESLVIAGIVMIVEILRSKE